jgi:hypothetical protein
MEDELQAVAEQLAARLRRAVAIDDPRMHLLVHTAHHGPVDPARMESILRLEPPAEAVRYVRGLGIAKAAAAVRVPGREDLQLLPRVVAPLRADGLLIGYLWIIDEHESLSDEELHVVEQAAAAAAEVLRRRAVAADDRAQRAQELVSAVLSGDRVSAAELREHEPWTAQDVRVLRTVPARPVTREALDRAVRTSGVHGLVAQTAPMCIVLVAASAEPAGVAEAVRGVADSPWCALGSAVPLEQVGQSLREAELAATVARAVPPDGAVVDWDGLGVYRLLVQLPLDRLPPGAIPDAVLPLRDSEGGRELLRTVEIYLDFAGDARSTVTALNVHRTSLYYRLGRFTELTGLDLADGGQRLAVHLGLKLLRLTTPVEGGAGTLPTRER